MVNERRVRCLSFWILVNSLNIIFSRSINLLANFMNLFFFTAEQYFIGYMYHIFLIHSSVETHFKYSHFLTTMNRVSMRNVEQVAVL